MLKQGGEGAGGVGALVVQAERRADGSVRYGIITRYETREAAADELRDLKPLAGVKGRNE